MGKKARIKREQCEQIDGLPDLFWRDAEGIHTSFLFPGETSPDVAAQMIKNFQKRIRNSPMWKQLVDQFREADVECLLKQCKAEIK